MHQTWGKEIEDFFPPDCFFAFFPIREKPSNYLGKEKDLSIIFGERGLLRGKQ